MSYSREVPFIHTYTLSLTQCVTLFCVYGKILRVSRLLSWGQLRAALCES